MFDAATSTASMSSAVTFACSMACLAAITPISHMTEGSSFERGRRRGTIRSGSIMPDLFITKRDLIPDAFSMNSTLEWPLASNSPAAIASAFSALYRSTQALKDSTSSSLLTDSVGVKSPAPEIATRLFEPVMVIDPLRGQSHAPSSRYKAGEDGRFGSYRQSFRSSERPSLRYVQPRRSQ